MVRKQRVQMFTLSGWPPNMSVAFRTFALNVRLFLGARSFHNADTLLRIFRPITVPLPQTSQRLATCRPLLGTGRQSPYVGRARAIDGEQTYHSTIRYAPSEGTTS